MTCAKPSTRDWAAEEFFVLEGLPEMTSAGYLEAAGEIGCNATGGGAVSFSAKADGVAQSDL